ARMGESRPRVARVLRADGARAEPFVAPRGEVSNAGEWDMMRRMGTLLLLASLSGCMCGGSGPFMGGDVGANLGGGHGPRPGTLGVARAAPSVPGVQGPWGQPVAVAPPYTLTAPTGEDAARQMLATSVPLEFVQQAGLNQPAKGGSGLQLAGGPLPVPPGGPLPPGGGPGLPPGGGPPATRPAGAVAPGRALT